MRRRKKRSTAPKNLSPEARKAIIAKYARLFPSGVPVTCTPAQKELSTGRNIAGWNTDGKIIFDTFAKATAAAMELQAAGGDWTRVYTCPRSGSGHCHLTSQKVRGEI